MSEIKNYAFNIWIFSLATFFGVFSFFSDPYESTYAGFLMLMSIFIGIISFITFTGIWFYEFVITYKKLLIKISIWIIMIPISLLGLNGLFNNVVETDESTPTVKGSTYLRDDDYSVERSYETYGDYDCSDFYSHSEAQDFFESEGGPDYDYHNLDSDGDGVACENL